MSDTNIKVNTKKNFFDVVDELYENKGKSIDKALANKERHGQEIINDPTFENMKMKKIHILPQSGYVDKKNESDNEYAARRGIEEMDKLYINFSDIGDIEQAMRNGINRCENWEQTHKGLDLSEAKRAIRKRFEKIEKIYKLRKTNINVDGVFKWLDDDVIDGASEKKLKENIEDYENQLLMGINNGRVKASMWEFKVALKKKENQLIKIIKARDELESKLKEIKKVIKQPWDDKKNINAIKEGIKLCINFQNTYYPAYKIELSDFTLPRNRTAPQWRSTLKVLRLAAKRSVNIKCIQHYIDFVIRTITPFITDFTNEKIEAPKTYTPDEDDIKGANNWMGKSETTKLVVGHLNPNCHLYMWPENWSLLRQFALGDCWLQSSLQGQILKNINVLSHLYNTISYTATKETERNQFAYQLVKHDSPISITLNQIMVDLIAKNGFLIIDLRRTNKTFTVTMNPDEITPVLVDPSLQPGVPKKPGLPGRSFMPVTATYGDPNSRPKNNQGNPLYDKAYILLPSVIQHGIAAVRRKKDSVVPNPNSSWDPALLTSLADYVRNDKGVDDLKNVEGERLTAMSGYVWLGLGNTKSTFHTRSIIGEKTEHWIIKQLKQGKVVNCCFNDDFSGSRFNSDQKTIQHIQVKEGHCYILHSISNDEKFFYLIDPNDECYHLGYTEENRDDLSLFYSRLILVSRKDFIKNVKFCGRA